MNISGVWMSPPPTVAKIVKRTASDLRPTVVHRTDGMMIYCLHRSRLERSRQEEGRFTMR